MSESLPENDEMGLVPPGAMMEDEESEEFLSTPEEREQFIQAIEIGAGTRSSYVFGHEVTVKTLTVAEELAIGRKMKEYENTHALGRAYRAALVAASLVTVDQVPFYNQIKKMSPGELLDTRFEKILDYYPAFVDEVHKLVKSLEQESAELLEKLGKSAG